LFDNDNNDIAASRPRDTIRSSVNKSKVRWSCFCCCCCRCYDEYLQQQCRENYLSLRSAGRRINTCYGNNDQLRQQKLHSFCVRQNCNTTRSRWSRRISPELHRIVYMKRWTGCG